MTTFLDDDASETIVNRVHARVLGLLPMVGDQTVSDLPSLDELPVAELTALEERLDAIVGREVDAFAETVAARVAAVRTAPAQKVPTP